MKKIESLFLIVVLFSIFLFGVTPKDPGYVFDLEGHRGCRGLRPENTLAAFEFALEEVGVTTIELDIGITRDGIPIVSHDRRLNGQKVQKNGKFILFGPLIRDLTLEELEEYDVGSTNSNTYYWPYQVQIKGEKIPTLEQVFDLVKDFEKKSGRKIFMNIETKIDPYMSSETVSPEEFVRILMETIIKNGMEESIIIQSFYWKTIMLVKESYPEITTSALVTAKTLIDSKWTNGLKLKDFDGDLGLLVKAAGADILSPNYSDCKNEWIDQAHSQELLVIPWTINDTKTMIEFIDKGVDGIITDYPNILKAVLATKGIELP